MKELRFMTEFQHLQRVMDAKESFERLNPGVKVVIEQSTDHFESKKAYESDEAPDIIESGGWSLFNIKDMFVDLNPYVAEVDGLKEDLYQGPMKVARHNGMLPGLPVDVSIPLLVFNKEMFDRAGLAYPTEDLTWDDFIEMGKKLTIRNEHGVASQFGFGIGVDIEWYEPFVFRNGGSYLSPNGTTARGYIDSPATIEAFRKVIDAYRVHGIIRKPDEPSEAGHLHEGFAMIFGYMWFTGDLIYHKIDDKFGVVGLPKMQGGDPSNMIYMGAAGVTSKSKNPRLAWEFLHHYIIERHSWPLPITHSQAKERGLTEHRLWSRYMEELDAVRSSGFYLSEKWNSSRQHINEDIHRMILDGTEVSQTLRSWTRFA
ncbi:extracellular solute-binding protein [Paenibacillus terrigena]|uniref:extracellular solute-binding protein n=1 Tax=Paenibacillus terrigena TaxID=369333 RepID=UPI0028D05EFD|nr:extracellular solute-binding protein [Paenibacillus terrigena]